MQTAVLFLTAIMCSGLAQAAMPLRDLKMLELFKYVQRLDQTMQHGTYGNLTLNNPGIEIKECCMKPALECYRSQLLKVNDNTSVHYKVRQILKSPLILQKMKGIASSEGCKNNPTCQSCDSYPSTDSKEFMAKLILLLNMANSN